MTASRIETLFAALAREGRAAFVPYIVAGDPDAGTAARILAGLPAAGADLIELGLPFSDPMADGPSVQKGAVRALASGMTTAGVLAMASQFRAGDAATPVILMGYYNPILSFGLEAFAEAAAASGVDGLIVVDLPPEEADPLADVLDARGVALVHLATPTADAARLNVIARRARALVYLVAVTGVTGVKQADPATVAPLAERVRAACNLPVAVGFGIRTPERAAQVARLAEAAVVGSALVDAITDEIAHRRDPAAKVLATVAAMAQAVRTARA